MRLVSETLEWVRLQSQPPEGLRVGPRFEQTMVVLTTAWLVFFVGLTAFFFFGVPAILLDGWLKLLALPIGVALSGTLIVGLRKGWIEIGD